MSSTITSGHWLAILAIAVARAGIGGPEVERAREREQTVEDEAEEREERLGRIDLRPYTGHTITSRGRLRAELDTVREQGWASTTEEFEIGLNAVAAPVHDATGEVVAAVGVSGPSYRLTVESFPSVAQVLIAGAEDISARLGHFGRCQWIGDYGHDQPDQWNSH